MCHESLETEAQHEPFLVVEVGNRIPLDEPEQPIHFVRIPRTFSFIRLAATRFKESPPSPRRLKSSRPVYNFALFEGSYRHLNEPELPPFACSSPGLPLGGF